MRRRRNRSSVELSLGSDVDAFRKGRQSVVLEGGSIEVNGVGSILTTEECLLSEIQARNPGLTREDMEEVFRSLSWRASHFMAAKRNSGRRHAWARRRSGAIHGCAYDGDCNRARPVGTEL